MDWDTLLAEGILTVEDGYVRITGSYNVYEDATINAKDNNDVSTFAQVYWDYVLSGDLVVSPDVVGIDMYAFTNTSLLTGVTLPSSVEVIGECAFMMCSDLKFVVMQDGLTEIWQMAFMASGVDKLHIPSTVTSIEVGALSGCDNLKKITVAEENSRYYSAGNCLIDSTTKTVVAACNTSVIPESDDVTVLGMGAYYGLSNLKQVSIPKNITSIEDENFTYCPNIETIKVAADNPVYSGAGNCLIEKSTKTIILGSKNSVIPDDGSVETITEMAFWARLGPETLVIPSTIKTVGAYAFRDSFGIKELIICGGVETLEEFCFYIASFEKVTITGKINEIGTGVFASCKNLKEVVLQDGFTEIGALMFEETGLQKITIPVSMTVVQPYAFDECADLTDIYYEGTMEQWNRITFGEHWNDETGNYTIHCSDGDITKN